MNFRANLLKVSMVVLLMIAGCKDNPTEPIATPSTIISGTVRIFGSSLPVPSALVADQGALGGRDSVDSNGAYSIDLGVLKSDYVTTLRVTAVGCTTLDTSVSIAVGKSLSLDLYLKIDTSGANGAGASGPNSIELLDPLKSHVIALKGSGNPETIVLTFVVKDSSGQPIVTPNQYWVNFVLISTTPSGGAFLNPDSARTNLLNGQVSITVCSGTNPTVLQVYASIRGTRAVARPVVIGAGGGLADPARVSIGATKLNIAGRVYGDLRTTVTLSASDRYGSPVFENTPVQFECNYGKLSNQQGLASTDKEGNAVIDLISTTNPPPTGLVTITATTSGDSSVSMVRPMQILFSGHTRTPGRAANAANFTVPDGQTNYFDIKVSDDLGYPLIEGSTVKITLNAADTLMKDLQLLFGIDGVHTFADTRDTNATNLRVSVMDKGTTKIAGYITFGIEIKSTNGDYTNPNWLTGYVSGSSSGNFNVPASIELADSSVSFLYLRETGLPGVTRRLSFVVKDALGNKIQSPTRARVDFAFLQAPNGTILSKTQDSTNSSGYVFVDITAGDTAGVALVSAMTLDVANSTLISTNSLPIEVAHGLPDSNKVFIELSKTNMFNKNGYQVGIVNLSLSDIFGSYAAPQSNLFSDIIVTTSGGWVSPVPRTVNGMVSVGLNANTYEPSDPVPGFGNVRAIVRVHGGGTTTKSVPFLFSYAPRITITSTAVVDTAAGVLQRSLADGGTEEIQFTVADKNGNPISSGNAINVSVSGDVASEISVTGDANLTLPETVDPLATNYRITIRDNTSGGGSQGSFKITIRVSGESGTVVKTIDGFLLAPGVIGGSTSGYAKYFELIDPLKKRSIYVRGSGGAGTGRPETVTLEFEARDSLGRTVDAAHSVMMKFAFEGETFGASIERDSGLTDAAGRFTTLIRSGTHSGVPYVRAYAVVNGDTIKSGLIDILISSGFADPFRFSVSAAKLNFPGMQWDGLEDVIRVQPFDRFGNPVPENTPVWFYCTHGGVQTENAYTDINGIIQQNHYSGGTRPIAPNNVPGQIDGVVFIKARTMGESGQDIWDSVRVIWTGAPVDPYTWTVTGPDPFAVPHTGSAGPWNFEIRDASGNPLSAGTTITVTAPGTIVDMDPITLPDTQAGENGAVAGGITNFRVNILDPHKATDPPEPKSTTLRVTVKHPIYGEYSFIIATGTID